MKASKPQPKLSLRRGDLALLERAINTMVNLPLSEPHRTRYMELGTKIHEMINQGLDKNERPKFTKPRKRNKDNEPRA